MKRRILVVDDEANECHGMAELLTGWGYEVATAGDGLEALQHMHRQMPHALLTDIRMPRLDGLQLLARVRQDFGALPVLVLTGQGSKEAVIECLRLRASDYIEKPIHSEELQRRLADLLRPAPPEARGPEGGASAFLGESEVARHIRRLIEQVAPTTASVLITGESGTGKEIVARAIHAHSPRADRTFLAINCSAIPESLMESEIFGHEKGAFTGAQERRAGCFELAEGGTLLLDEVGEMPPGTQAKLLRVLEERRVRRLGSKQEIAVNVRVLAATNRSPQQAVADGQLRSDLYYRLNVFHLHLAPLRERTEDLPVLAAALLAQLNQRHGRSVARIGDDVMRMFRAYRWPGNVRELRNLIERAVIVADGNQLEARHLPEEFGAPAAGEPSACGPHVRVPAGSTVAEAERLLILHTLEQEHNNKTRAAERLGISLKTLQNKLKEYAAARGAPA